MKTVDELYDQYFLNIWEYWDFAEPFSKEDIKDQLDEEKEEYDSETINELYEILKESQKDVKEQVLEDNLEELKVRLTDEINDYPGYLDTFTIIKALVQLASDYTL